MHPPSILCILITQWKEINWFHFLLEQLELASYFFFLSSFRYTSVTLEYSAVAS